MPVVVDRGDQAVFVAADVEHRESIHMVGTGERCPQIVEVREYLLLHDAMPGDQRRLGRRMLRPELDQDGLGDHVHFNQCIPKRYIGQSSLPQRGCLPVPFIAGTSVALLTRSRHAC